MESRKIWVDELRGLAILLVVLGHVIGGLQNFGGGETHILWRIIYTFHMPLMFVISGYVGKVYKSTPPQKNMRKICIIKNLILSLYIPYLIWGYAFWGVKYFIYSGNESVTLEQGINLFWNNRGWGPGWFLLTLLVIKIIDIYIQQTKLIYQIVFWGICALIGANLDVYLVSSVFEYGIFYCIGRAINVLYRNSVIPLKNLIINAIMICCGVCLYTYGETYFGKVFVGCSVSVILFWVFSMKKHSFSFLELMGKNSMITYVLHAYFTIPARVILILFNCNSLIIYILVEMIAAIGGSYIVIWLTNKWKWVKSLFYPKLAKGK